MRAWLPALWALLLGGAGSATAVGTDSISEDSLRQLDVDHSGKIEQSDLEAFAKAAGLPTSAAALQFKEFDKNGDGTVDVAELTNSLAQPEVVQASIAADSVVGVHEKVGIGANDAVLAEVSAYAGTALAELFANASARVLASRQEDFKLAAQLEESARALRGQAKALKQTVPRATILAAQLAAQAETNVTAGQIRDLEVQAGAAEQESVKHQQRAQAALALATQAQKRVTASMQSPQVHGAL